MNHYQTLGISQTASEKEIKQAYRKLAMKHHPDRNKGTQASEEEFKKVNEAYSILSDPSKKRDYDYSLRHAESFAHHGTRNSGYRGNEDDMNDFVHSFFRQGSPFEDIFGHYAQRQQTFQAQLDFWEAVFGAEKTFEFNIPHNGKIEKARVTINFPAGTNTGDVFEIQAAGKTLQLQVVVGENSQFRRDNLDLYTTIEIPMTTAILGGNIRFVHWEKTLDINIPPGVRHEQMIRLPNSGIKKGIFTGDLYFICKVVLPTKLTKRQQELLEEFAELEKNQKKTFGENFKEVWNKFFKAS